MVASSSAFFLPLSPPANGSSIDSDWSTRNRKQPGFLRLISAWYAMVFLQSERGQPEDEISRKNPGCFLFLVDQKQETARVLTTDFVFWLPALALEKNHGIPGRNQS